MRMRVSRSQDGRVKDVDADRGMLLQVGLHRDGDLERGKVVCACADQSRSVERRRPKPETNSKKLTFVFTVVMGALFGTAEEKQGTSTVSVRIEYGETPKAGTAGTHSIACTTAEPYRANASVSSAAMCGACWGSRMRRCSGQHLKATGLAV